MSDGQRDGLSASTGAERIVELTDERDPRADGTFRLIADSFPPQERHPLAQLRSELEEKRRGLLTPFDFHLLAALTAEARPLAGAAGVYLAGINAGFITYLAVEPESRGRGLGHTIRGALVDAFRSDARASAHGELAWVLGEVQLDSDWLRALVRRSGAIAFDLRYYHPGMPREGGPDYLLYREPIADRRLELSTMEVRQILYAVWRRAYRVRYPLERETFRAMIEELERRDHLGPHPIVHAEAREGGE